jgi:hypothetical protein
MLWWWPFLVTFVEVVFLFAVGLFLSTDQKYEALSSIWAVVGVVLVVHRQFVIFEVRSELKETKKSIEVSLSAIASPLQKAAEVVDLSNRSDVQSMNVFLKEYLRLGEEKLAPERQRIVVDAIAALKLLNSTMKTPTLEEPDFYQWLYHEFDNAAPGTRIQIVSMDEAVEWNETFQEQQYFKKNVEAAKRGVLLERIFFFSSERLTEAAKNKFIRAHGEGNTTRLIGRRVDRATFSTAAPTAVRDAGQGFILVNDRFVIVDVFSSDGQARGYVTFDPNEVQKYRETFKRFHSLSAPLVFPASS